MKFEKNYFDYLLLLLRQFSTENFQKLERHFWAILTVSLKNHEKDSMASTLFYKNENEKNLHEEKVIHIAAPNSKKLFTFYSHSYSHSLKTCV